MHFVYDVRLRLVYFSLPARAASGPSRPAEPQGEALVERYLSNSRWSLEVLDTILRFCVLNRDSGILSSSMSITKMPYSTANIRISGGTTRLTLLV